MKQKFMRYEPTDISQDSLRNQDVNQHLNLANAGEIDLAIAHYESAPRFLFQTKENLHKIRNIQYL